MRDRLRSVAELPLVRNLVGGAREIGAAVLRAWRAFCRTRLGRWATRWRRVLVPVLVVLVALGSLGSLLVLSNRADQTQLETTLQGLSDDRCIRLFAAEASTQRTALVDAQARVTVETFGTTSALARGLIAGLITDDEAGVLLAVDALNSSIDDGDEQIALVVTAARRAAVAEERLREVSRTSRDDRDHFDELCAAGP